MLLVLGGCGILLALLLVFGVTVGLVVYASVKPNEQAENKEAASDPKAEHEGAARLLDEREPNREVPDRPPPTEVLSKTLATMDRLTIEVAPPQAEDVSVPEVWRGHTASVRGVAFTDDGRFVVSVSGAIQKADRQKEDNSIRVWDAHLGRQVRKLDGFHEALDAVSLSPGGRFAVFGHGGHYEEGKFVNAVDHHVRLWDIQDNREIYIRKGGDDDTAKPDPRFQGLDSSVFSTAFSPDRQRVAGVANSGKLILWESGSGRVLVEGEITPVARRRIDPASLSCTSYSLSGINCIRFTPDGRWLLMGGGDYTVRLFDVATGTQLYSFESHQDIVWAVAATRTKTGRLLGLSGGGGQQRLRSGGFEPGARDYAIRLWDLETRREVGRFVGHEGSVNALVFCPNGRHFLSAGNDRTVRLWDISRGTLLRTYRGHMDLIRSISVAPDGRAAVSGSDDCTIRYWRLPATAEDLILALDKKNRADLTAAIRDLDTMGPELRAAYPKLIQVLRENDKEMAELALAILRRLGQPDREWVNGLRKLLIGPLPAARSFAAESLAALGTDAFPARDELRKALRDPDPAVRRAAVTSLANLGKDAREAADDLARLVEQEKDGILKAEAVHALGKIDGKNKVVLQHLRDMIAGENSAERTAALKNLLDLGPEADALEVCLQACLDPVNRNLARAALEKMSLGKAEVPRLTKALEDDRVEVRLMAVALLARMGADAVDAKPALRKCLKDREGHLRFESALALTALDPTDKEVAADTLPALVETLKEAKSGSKAPQRETPLGGRRRGLFPPGLRPPLEGKKDKPAPPDDNATRAREAVVRIGQPAAAELFKALRDNGGDDENQREMRQQIYLTFSALGPKAYTPQNRAALNSWAKKEQTRATRYGSNELFQAAFQAATSLKPAGR